MSDKPLQHRFDVLCQITRAQHFAWRAAVADLCPDVDPAAVTDKMWELTGVQTGAAYAKRLDRSKPIAAQVAASIVWSSECMGEDAIVEIGEGADEAFVRHHDCPWFHWHKRLDLLAEDRPGCDMWFSTSVDRVNEACGTTLRVETLEALPDGDSCCLRRFWVEQPTP
ncbi:MAG: hypothetical protein GY898_26345 [Proteobacteria bacterium]|nr:hypothetical protein [Pseudomonadota bacterium]